MTKKYVVFPGTVKSITDGQIHRVTAVNLMRLYRVNPAECVVYNGYLQHGVCYYRDLIALYPRDDGNYNIQNKGEIK